MLRRLGPSITALVGLSSAIKNESFGPLSEAQHRQLDEILHAAGDLAHKVATLEQDLCRPSRARPIRILVADDDPTNIEIATIVLRTDGCEVDLHEAQAAPTAVAMAREVHPDLVFMDVRMPGE